MNLLYHYITNSLSSVNVEIKDRIYLKNEDLTIRFGNSTLLVKPSTDDDGSFGIRTKYFTITCSNVDDSILNYQLLVRRIILNLEQKYSVEQLFDKRDFRYLKNLKSSKIPVISFEFQALSPHIFLAVGNIVEYAKNFKNKSLQQYFNFLPMLPDSHDLLSYLEEIKSAVILFSCYSWTTEHQLKVASKIKELNPSFVTIFGGPDIPRYQNNPVEFIKNYTQVDYIVMGEGEYYFSNLLELMSKFDLNKESIPSQELPGICYKKKSGEIVNNNFFNEKVRDFSFLNSPYTSGFFDLSLHSSRMMNGENLYTAIIETNRGCPFGCTFCDWGASTLSKLRLLPIEKIEKEIEWLSQKQFKHIIIADSNFCMLERDVEIAKIFQRYKKIYGYPNKITFPFAKANLNERIVRISKVFVDSGIEIDTPIAIQTTDPVVLKNISRSNIKLTHFSKLVALFRSFNLDPGTELMLGLPGSTFETLKRDLQWVFNHNIRFRMYKTCVLPNSPMADSSYIKQFKIRMDAKKTIISTYSYNENDLKEMIEFVGLYEFLVNLNIFKFVLIGVQQIYGIESCNILQKLFNKIKKNDTLLKNLKSEFDLFLKLNPDILDTQYYNFNFNMVEKLIDELETYLSMEASTIDTELLRDLVLFQKIKLLPYAKIDQIFDFDWCKFFEFSDGKILDGFCPIRKRSIHKIKQFHENQFASFGFTKVIRSFDSKFNLENHVVT